ncbi:hypothetical protein ES708_24267 [subsurface metagenome]
MNRIFIMCELTSVMYEISVSDEALAYIKKFQEDNFPEDELAILFADPHALGGVVSIELYRRNFMADRFGHFQELKVKNMEYPFGVFIDRQIIQENLFPERVEIFMRNNLKGIPILDYKNLDFEE